MAGFRTFEEIAAWQEARVLVGEIYSATGRVPFCTDFGLREQVQRAAVSIGSNIAEGFARRGNREFIKFLWIAKGSAAEVATQLYFAKDLSYIDEQLFNKLYARAKKISAMLFNLITSIKDPARLK